MPTELIETPVVESPEGEPLATPDFETQISTLNKRLTGKDQALTRAQQERDQMRAEAEALRQWKLSKEQADMTEVQKLQAERDQARADAQAARSEATAARLARDFPLAAQILGDNLALADSVKLAEIEARLKAGTDETEPPARVDPNLPRRSPAPPAGKSSYEQLRDEFMQTPSSAWLNRP